MPLASADTHTPAPMDAVASHHTHGLPDASLAVAAHVDSFVRVGRPWPSVAIVHRKAFAQEEGPSLFSNGANGEGGSSASDATAASHRRDTATTMTRMRSFMITRIMGMGEIQLSSEEFFFSGGRRKIEKKRRQMLS